MIQRLPFHHPATTSDVVRLRKLLADALAAVGFHRPGKVAVLNLACGRADETGALASVLGPAQISYYLGIDLRADTIAEATRRWELPDGKIEFRRGDASMIGRMKSLPKFDFVFIRHQNYWDDPTIWDRIPTNTLALLAPDGILACTSYFDREHELLTAALKTCGSGLLWSARHPSSRPLPNVTGKSADRHLAIFKKPGARSI